MTSESTQTRAAVPALWLSSCNSPVHSNSSPQKQPQPAPLPPLPEDVLADLLKWNLYLQRLRGDPSRSFIEAMMPNVATIHCGPYCEAAAIKSLCEVARYEELCKEGTDKDTTRVFPSSTRGRRSYRYCDSPSSHQEYKERWSNLCKSRWASILGSILT